MLVCQVNLAPKKMVYSPGWFQVWENKKDKIRTPVGTLASLIAVYKQSLLFFKYISSGYNLNVGLMQDVINC